MHILQLWYVKSNYPMVSFIHLQNKKKNLPSAVVLDQPIGNNISIFN